MSSLSFDQIGHAPGGPERGTIAQRFGALLQALAQLLQLLRLQAGLAARPCGPAQGLGPLLLPSLMPATDRLAVNAQSSGDFSLAQTTVKEPGSLETPPFQFVKITPNTFWITHGRNLS